MKKLICAVFAIVLCLVICGCGYTASASYPNADKYSVGSFTYDAAAVQAVEINWTAGRVELTESDGAKLSVTETTEGLTPEQQMRWWLDGSTLRIQYWKSGYTGTLNNKEKRVTVEIPKDISLNVQVTSGVIQAGNHQVNSLTLKATSGNIVLGAVNTDSAVLTCTSGSVTVGPLRARNKIEITCTSGEIKVDNAMADTIALNTTSGKITAGPLDAAGAMTASTTSGSMKLDAVKAKSAKAHSTSGDIQLGIYQCETVDVSCTSGDVTLSVLHGSGATVDFKTNSGTLNGKDAKKSAQQVFGDGASQVSISTTSGDVRLMEKEQ